MADPNAIRQALAQAIDALSMLADQMDAEPAAPGAAPQAPGAAPGAPAGAPAPSGPPAPRNPGSSPLPDNKPSGPPAGGPPGGPPKPEEEAKKAPGEEKYLENMPGGSAPPPAAPQAPQGDVCPACGRPMQQPGQMRMSADMSYSEFPHAKGPEDLAGSKPGEVIYNQGMNKAAEPAGGDEFHPAKPQGKPPADEGGSMGLGSPANPGNTQQDLSSHGEAAVIMNKSAYDPMELGKVMGMVVAQQLAPIADSLNKAHERIANMEGQRQGRKSLAKSASATWTKALETETPAESLEGNELTKVVDAALGQCLLGRLSIGDRHGSSASFEEDDD